MAGEGQQQECKGANTTRKSWLNWLEKDGVKLAISQENQPVIPQRSSVMDTKGYAQAKAFKGYKAQ